MDKVVYLQGKNQFVIYNSEKGIYYFQSYDSVVAKVDNKKLKSLTLYKNWNYSNATRTHLYLFLYHYCYEVYSLISGSYSKRKEIEKLIKEKRIRYQDKRY